MSLSIMAEELVNKRNFKISKIYLVMYKLEQIVLEINMWY